jgi:cysteinyl-tRNA synthetase
LPLGIYNTLSHRVEDFRPLDPRGRRVTFYSCGPTVYDYAHIGNFRSFLNADLLRRALELLGHEVVHVMNMTDVGHMTEDDAGAEGEDRMEVASRRLLEAKKAGRLPAEASGVDPGDPFAIADFYAAAFLHDARALGLGVALEAQSRPELMPRPTRYIRPMIALVEKLIGTGHAYVAGDGAVYFDVRSFPDYGRLSNNTLDALREAAGGRVAAAHQAVKRHPADFLLWKPDARHIMRWPSPWGEGYPGWHLECSAMAMDLLGRDTNGVIDIHSGGEDNVFPHHESEIAQTCCATGEPFFARYWFHTRHLRVEGEKMSKSKGNFYTLGDVLARGASPAAVRLELTKTHYTVNANFTFQGLEDSQRMINRWSRVERLLAGGGAADGTRPLAAALPEFRDALADDLNATRAIAALHGAAGRYPQDEPPARGGRPADAAAAAELDALRAMMRALGVLEISRAADTAAAATDESFIKDAIRRRNQARAERDFATSDRIRRELLEKGVALHDGPQGTTWSLVVQK